MKRRDFVKLAAAGAATLPFAGCESGTTPPPNPPPVGTGNAVFRVVNIPWAPCGVTNHHAGIDALLKSMGANGLKLYRSPLTGAQQGPNGLIAADDIVLIKVNAQWKYRGCTNSDVIRGLIQVILEHPDRFAGEVVIIENGQGRGSLACDTSASYGGNTEVHANAYIENHSFLWLVDELFKEPRVSAYLLDPIRETFIADDDHTTEGYRRFENVSYPCFTTPGGRRVELKDGIWTGASHGSNLKLINVPVLKHHDVGGSEITGALKHMYGLLSMADGQSNYRHYAGLGETCGKMFASVHTPVLNIIDAMVVSPLALNGYPDDDCWWTHQLIASQDPVALDYWAAKHVLYPTDNNARHDPDFPGISAWLSAARTTIVDRGGLIDAGRGIVVDKPTMTESEMLVHSTAPSGG